LFKGICAEIEGDIFFAYLLNILISKEYLTLRNAHLSFIEIIMSFFFDLSIWLFTSKDFRALKLTFLGRLTLGHCSSSFFYLIRQKFDLICQNFVYDAYVLFMRNIGSPGLYFSNVLSDILASKRFSSYHSLRKTLFEVF
jgi:hypothetical protein